MADTRGVIILKQGRARPVLQRHPWIFSGAIARIEGEPADGAIVEVCDAGRNWLARGYLNRQSQIVVRLLTWRRDEPVDDPPARDGFWQRRLEQAIAARRELRADPRTTAYRLVHAESDYLPGLIVDRYGDWLVFQALTLGIERRKGELVNLLVGLVDGLRGIYERSDADVRDKEGLPPCTGVMWGEPPPERIEVLENGRFFLVDVRQGHKTGFYLDQRENRARLKGFCDGAEVLDAFAYTGGFSVYAAAGGARRLTLFDSSAPALELARRNIALNVSTAVPAEYVTGDVFTLLRNYRSAGRFFDVIVLDPPKLAHRRTRPEADTSIEVQRAARAYKDANLVAFQLLRAGGVLFTFSCSGAVSADLFQKIVFGAALDAGREVQIVGWLTQGSDHPVALSFPEGLYLKGLICRATDY